jgi:ribosomal protein S18 acetylase RimI-like enzyme
MKPVQIRPAAPDDCEAIAAMVIELARLFGVKAGTTAGFLREGAFGARPSFDILVAQDAEGGLVGYLIHQNTLSTWRGANGVFVVDLFVHPHWRNDGIGDKLTQAAARAGQAKGARFMRLDIDENNHAARRFYERQGFRPLEHDCVLVLDEAKFRALAKK